MIDRYIRSVQVLSRLGAGAAIILLLLAMVVVCQMILMRYFFKAPTIWQTEAVVFSATAAIFIGAPYVLMTKGHVGVDVVQMLVSQSKRKVLEGLGSVAGLAFCLVMCIAFGLHWWEAFEGGWTTPSVAAVPLWWPLTPVVLGFFLLVLQYIAELLKLCCAKEDI